MFGYLAVAMTARLLPLNDGWFSPLHFQAIRGGVFGTWLCLASLHYHGVLLKYLPVSVILFGLMSLAGVIAQREEAPRQTGDGAETGASPPQIAAISFFVLLVAALVAGGLERAILGGVTSEPSWLMRFLTAGIFAAATFFISQHRRFPRDLVWAIPLAAAALALYQFLAADRGAALLLSVWLFVVGAVAGRRFPEADQRPHLFDRCRRWWSSMP